MSKKRPRAQTSVDVEVVAIFEDLANDDEEIRLKAAMALLSKVSVQNDPGVEQLNKILKRLIRGLCSGRKSARLGFSVALTEFVAQHASTTSGSPAKLSVSKVMDVLEEQTRFQGSVSGQEERDHYFGRVFGAESLIKSRILFAASNTEAEWQRLLDFIYTLAKKKPWLREECGWVLHGSLGVLNYHDNGLKYAQHLVDKLQSNGLSKTPEGVAIWITARTLYPDIQVPTHTWHNDDPLNPKEKATLAKILMETTTNQADKNGPDQTIQRGMWSSRLHFAWAVVFESILTPQPKRVKFAALWAEVIEDGLFAQAASEERKAWGFMLFQAYIQSVDKILLHILFGKNFVRCLVNQLASTERYLHKIADKTMKSIFGRVQSEPETAVEVLGGFINSNGNISFDIQTKTKTVEKLLAQADDTSVKAMTTMFSELLLHPGTTEEKAAAASRQVIADYLLSAIRSRPLPEEPGPSSEVNSNVDMILSTFVEHAYFLIQQTSVEPHKLPAPPISDTSREMFKSRISSSLTHLMAKSSNTSYYPYTVLATIRLREQNTDGTMLPLMSSSGNVVSKSIDRAWKAIEKIHTKVVAATDARKEYLRAFELLFSLTALQVYNGNADAASMLEELQECYKTLVKHKSSAAQGEGSEILVEILLSLVSKPSLLFRRLAQQVFSVCTHLINENGLKSMLSVLETKETISGQDEIFDKIHDEGSDIEMSDASMEGLDAEESDAEDCSNSDSDSVGEADGTEEDDVDEEELAAFDAKLAAALGTRRADDDLAVAEEESSDEDMNDEQMEALDEQLENVFRQRKMASSKKKERKDAKETIILFKCRVLELLEIYIKQEHLKMLAVELVIPLLGTIRKTTSKQVSEKACSVVREYSKAYRLKDQDAAGASTTAKDNDVALARSVLGAIHAEACRAGSNAHAAACSQASLLLAKITVSRGGQVADVILQYAETQRRFTTDPACAVRTAFFSDFLNWCTSVRKRGVAQ